MRQKIHFYYWLAAIVVWICCTNVAFAQTQATDLSQIKAGCDILIYPYGHYGEDKMALACSGDGMPLTSYENSGPGSLWTVVYAGDGYYYLRNHLGCY